MVDLLLALLVQQNSAGQLRCGVHGQTTVSGTAILGIQLSDDAIRVPIGVHTVHAMH